jgi:sugar/nucleoside kinase (ribokinase family)
MRKLGSLKLHDTVVMSDSELKHIVGGTGDPSTTEPGSEGTVQYTKCQEKSESECSGICFANGVKGTCGWTKEGELKGCTCATAQVG